MSFPGFSGKDKTVCFVLGTGQQNCFMGVYGSFQAGITKLHHCSSVLVTYYHATILPQTQQPKTMHIYYFIAQLSWILCMAAVWMLARVAVLSETRGPLPNSLRLLTAFDSRQAVRPRPQFHSGSWTPRQLTLSTSSSQYGSLPIQSQQEERETPTR